MFVPGTNSWGAIGAATKATSNIATRAESLSEAASRRRHASNRGVFLFRPGGIPEAAALEIGATPETTTLAALIIPEAATQEAYCFYSIEKISWLVINAPNRIHHIR